MKYNYMYGESAGWFDGSAKFVLDVGGMVYGFKGINRTLGISKTYRNLNPNLQSALMFYTHGNLRYFNPDEFANTTWKDWGLIHQQIYW